MHSDHAATFSSQVQFLMGVSATMYELAGTPESCKMIPGYLARTLRLPGVTLALLELKEDGEGFAVHVIGSSTEESADAAQWVESVLPKPVAGSFLHGGVAEKPEPEEQMQVATPRGPVFRAVVDERHQLLLLVHKPREAAIIPENIRFVEPIVRQLAFYLECLIRWGNRQEIGDVAMRRLSDKQWEIFCSLDSATPEKQLATELKMSPHTLHSHIKSIYKLLAVQGRLEAMRYLAAVRRAWRIERINRPTPCAANGETMKFKTRAAG